MPVTYVWASEDNIRPQKYLKKSFKKEAKKGCNFRSFFWQQKEERVYINKILFIDSYPNVYMQKVSSRTWRVGFRQSFPRAARRP